MRCTTRMFLMFIIVHYWGRSVLSTPAGGWEANRNSFTSFTGHPLFWTTNHPNYIKICSFHYLSRVTGPFKTKLQKGVPVPSVRVLQWNTLHCSWTPFFQVEVYLDLPKYFRKWHMTLSKLVDLYLVLRATNGSTPGPGPNRKRVPLLRRAPARDRPLIRRGRMFSRRGEAKNHFSIETRSQGGWFFQNTACMEETNHILDPM